MKFGTAAQLTFIEQKLQKNPKQLEELRGKLRWANADIWYLPEDGDGPTELEKLAKLTKTEVYAQCPATDAKPVKKHTQEQPFGNITTYDKPPPFVSKVLQYVATITGPQVRDEVFQERLSKCTKEGGCTFATTDGIVEAVGKGFIKVGTTLTLLQRDETPCVEVGQEVKYGQTVAKSNNIKPCPLLATVEHKGATKYFCSGCGCGQRDPAELHNKLRYARVSCPRTPPQFTSEDENGPNIKV